MSDQRDDRDELVAALRDLAVHLDVPDAPDVSSAVQARIAEPPALPSRWRWHGPTANPRLAAGVLVAAAVVALIMVVPASRDAVADLLGLKGNEIEYKSPRTTVTTAPPGREDLGLGETVDLEEARRRLPELIVPTSALGEPDRIVASPDRPEVSLVYLDGSGATRVLLTEYRGDAGQFFHKMVRPSTDVEPVTVNGGRGLWISGPDHVLFYTDPDGRDVVSEGRLSGSALLWEQGEIVLRMEGSFTKAEALAIAETMS